MSLSSFDPRFLEVEGAVLGNLVTFLALDDRPRTIVDIGHSKTPPP